MAKLLIVDGLAKANSADFDLIITDVNMSNMDRLTLIDELRKIPKYSKKPILVLTTERSDEMKTKGKATGAIGSIVKPFVPDQLLAKSSNRMFSIFYRWRTVFYGDNSFRSTKWTWKNF